MLVWPVGLVALQTVARRGTLWVVFAARGVRAGRMDRGAQIFRGESEGLTNNHVLGRMGPMKGKMRLTDQLRRAIEGGPKSRYQIAKETGIDEATLSRFVHYKGGLSMDGLDAIAECLGLSLTTATKPRGKKGR